MEQAAADEDRRGRNQTEKRLTDKAEGRAEAAALREQGWDVVRLLGQGAFSRVFLVKGGAAGELLACKVSRRRELLCREGRLLEKTSHPLFPAFGNLWERGDRAFLLMEYVPGECLEAHLRRRGRFSEAQAARVGMELAEGLRFLHQMPEPVLFRDVKPANIMIRQDGRAKLLDMGCAWEPGRPADAVAGTPGYGAPEQFISGAVLSCACDVYGLGRVLEAMAGKGCGGGLGRLIASCTAPDPGRRPPDMQGVMAALAPLCRKGKKGEGVSGKGGSRGDSAVCLKNIWESRYKNT